MSFRYKRRGLHATLTACAVSVGLLAGTTHSASASVPCPSVNTAASVRSFTTTWPTRGALAKGVTMCHGLGSGGESKLWLQIVDLRDGAKIRLMQVDDHEAIEHASERGEPDAVFEKRTAPTWISWLRYINEIETCCEYLGYYSPRIERLFSVTNAAFFTNTEFEVSTTVPFPLFMDRGLAASEGLSYRRGHERGGERDGDWNAPKKSLMVSGASYEERPQAVRVESFPSHYERRDVVNGLNQAGGPESYNTEDALVSFTPEYRVGESNRRNYLGTYGSAVYLVTTDALYTNAQMILIMEGIHTGMSMIQLDGGGSAQLSSAYGSMDSSIPIANRQVPSFLAIYRAR